MFDIIRRHFKGLKICYVCKQELYKEMFYKPITDFSIGFTRLLYKSCKPCRVQKAKEIGNPLFCTFEYHQIEEIGKRNLRPYE